MLLLELLEYTVDGFKGFMLVLIGRIEGAPVDDDVETVPIGSCADA